MAVFFNGRLLISPTTASVVDDNAMANQNLSVGNVLAIVGRSNGGQPGKALRFGSPGDAERVLRDGELLTAVKKAFSPSNQTGGPTTVIAVRVNPATQGELALKDSLGATVINLKSTDYGMHTNQIKIKVESGSVSGKKLTTQYGNAYFTADNVTRNALSVHYTGTEATATMSITGVSVTLEAPAATAVASIDLNSFKTVQELVDRINATPDFVASVLDGNHNRAALNGLDFVTDQDVKTAPHVVKADLQAVVDWINSAAEGFVTATRETAVGTVPANTPFTYLAGGSDGIITNSEWSSAFEVLRGTDAQWVVPLSSDSSIHAMTDAHVQFMSTVGKMERRAIVGGAAGTTDDDAKLAAKNLNSDRTSYVHLGYYDYDKNGNLTLFEPYQLAALIGGMFSGVNPGTPLTNKSIRAHGLERDLRNPTDTDELIKAGILCVENTAAGYKVVQSISTWLVNDNYNRVEQSTGTALDFVVRNVREAVDVLRGEKGNPLVLSRAVSITESTLRELARQEPQGPGVIVGNAEVPAYRNIQASLEGDVLRIQFECSPVIPVNYVLVTVFAVPFSGVAVAA